MDAGRHTLGFSVSIGMDSVLVWVVDIDMISMWGIEHDLDSVKGSELIWFMSGCRK